MNVKDAAKESSIRAGYNPNIAADAVGQTVYETAFIAGAEWERLKAIEAYRNICSSYKISPRYECGNYTHRLEWKTKVCDMNCQYMKNLMEKI